MNVQTAASTLAYNTRRTGGWWVVSSLALLGVLILAKQQLGVLLFKLAQISLSVCLAYWVDRAMFRYAPKITLDMPRDTYSAARIIARALIVVAVVLGFALGL